MYLAYILCVVGSAVSIFYIILYGHSFGVDLAKRWVVSMVVALLESLFIIEPMKVSFCLKLVTDSEIALPNKNLCFLLFFCIRFLF